VAAMIPACMARPIFCLELFGTGDWQVI